MEYKIENKTEKLMQLKVGGFFLNTTKIDKLLVKLITKMEERHFLCQGW